MATIYPNMATIHPNMATSVRRCLGRCQIWQRSIQIWQPRCAGAWDGAKYGNDPSKYGNLGGAQVPGTVPFALSLNGVDFHFGTNGMKSLNDHESTLLPHGMKRDEIT
jgi:hypothetical protein